MSSQQQQNSQQRSLNALSFLQQASNNRINNGRGDGGGSQIQNRATFPSSGFDTSNSGTNAQQQQQQQQALVGALGLGDSMNDLASFALSGDLAKAIQLANVGLLQGGAADNGLGSAASMYQQLQLQQLQQLELQRSQPTMHQQGSSAKASIANPYEQTALENTSDQHSMAGGSARSASRYAVRSANSVQPTEKEDNAKRTLVVPCRARGMTMEHNFQTAFFEIAENIKHGYGLICTFPECRNRGVKFLYCAFCKDPVAKRNFRNRHNHTEMANSEEDTETGCETKDSASSKRRERKPPIATCTIISTSADQVSEGGGSISSGVKYVKPDGKKRTASVMASVAPDDALDRKFARIDTERKDAWNSLLANRPHLNAADEMSSWLMRVMAVSDPRKSISEVREHSNPVYNKPEPG